MIEKLKSLLQRHADIELKLNDPNLLKDRILFRDTNREYKQLTPIVDVAKKYIKIYDDFETNKELYSDKSIEIELRELASGENKELAVEKVKLEEELRFLLIPKDPNDLKNCIMEIRAGTGGDEAGLFAGDLMRMYKLYCDKLNYKMETINFTESEKGGFKELVIAVNGEKAFGLFKYESGVHRVQRVPETESQGRVHTSAATVAVLPEAEEIDVEIRDEDLKIDTYRASGAGGQHVNKTDSAIRITHLPSGLVVTSQDERSQIKNRERAMKVLRAKLYEQEARKQHDKIASSRKSMVKSGDRSEKIRTYNWPQNRVTDHRLEGEAKNYSLREIIEGNLDLVISNLQIAERAEILKNA